mgnify:CR=1 FL=1
MSKFTAAELVEFYQKVADGGVMSLKKGFDDEPQNNYVGPNMTSPVEYWRIKPAKKLIDMAHFIESGIDFEFSDDETWIMLAGLVEIDLGCKHPYTNIIGVRWKQCRPRMNHKMFHDGGDCPIPEGFTLRLYFRDEAPIVDDIHEGYNWIHCGSSNDIIGYEILGLADGWTYPWECGE